MHSSHFSVLGFPVDSPLGQLGDRRRERLCRRPLLPGAAAVLLGLKPGLGAASGPEPCVFSVCLALLLHHRDFIIRVLRGNISRQSPKTLGSAVLLICTDGKPAFASTSRKRAAGVSVAGFMHF
jgi:hypothetical protein